ncbi:NAD(P)H-dependent oxidoreductase [Vibrio parahaemolyticus]|uniref:NADPH-dependent FMN reductase n=1 Tax=Vibrio parahaemolyticus TaxID=670 RepID=UPI000813CF2B|nr:NAD(P)H-dependent oxidoreductase [Vibrio parahaemolyticus]EGQ8248072.1 NAD(P)H-dependent oxidoreductase [Vibrio parahaemolyticus]EGQ8931084.1 NAD(P)H-dependent oxidoreductase [Vibrio parahaemolyticus]EGQ8975557.1 NAD(P)H-dependent oxidoreductase [Vibrio parahaemolyticus]EGQ8980103.1 NAD(P)H-dependent oxidoreductase [Vibrio parahaemolyticus]EGQ8999184.1 NAD(P)H-dependent oxidoreductase [Vibrio parahaemolyticus]
MYILVVSSSLDPESRSRQIANLCIDELQSLDRQVKFVDLAELNVPNFDNDKIYQTEQYKVLHKLTSEASGLVLCSPIYNWGCCSELKKYIEYVGSTPPDGSLTGALFDKVVTFVTSAGLPHSYMADSALSTSLSIDFKCIINPYNLYVHNRHWVNDALSEERQPRLEKSMKVMDELCSLLSTRTYKSGWEL